LDHFFFFVVGLHWQIIFDGEFHFLRLKAYDKGVEEFPI